ncbi:hypothetical protein VHEMI01852 [[Torrubiella] hemipterigena]|uniref:Concanavalin A-like lectin/glucanase n=1 Tax=[Torrubiella] hemipterigena TaxID=1531966 RepID=A0A0A1T8Q4_9HYPO|nr:hypothetical protein VHEMI01852 [[Torrubiella] hemipterigena]
MTSPLSLALAWSDTPIYNQHYPLPSLLSVLPSTRNITYSIIIKFINTLALATSVSAVALPETRTSGGLERRGHRGNSDNWAGVIKKAAGVKTVTGTMGMPTIKNGAEDSAVSAWVGIDGNTCSTGALLQTGVDILGDGTFSPWVEWYPNDLIKLTDFVVNAGDKIKMTVTATSTTAGSAKLENLTTGNSSSHDFAKGPAALCLAEADWILEDYDDDNSGKIKPLVNFGTVSFTGASASGGSDGTVGPDKGEIITLTDSKGKAKTSCSVKTNTVTCSYNA